MEEKKLDKYLELTAIQKQEPPPQTVDTELQNAVKATDMKAQYDASAKRLLGQKSILAHILLE